MSHIVTEEGPASDLLAEMLMTIAKHAHTAADLRSMVLVSRTWNAHLAVYKESIWNHLLQRDFPVDEKEKIDGKPRQLYLERLNEYMKCIYNTTTSLFKYVRDDLYFTMSLYDGEFRCEWGFYMDHATEPPMFTDPNAWNSSSITDIANLNMTLERKIRWVIFAHAPRAWYEIAVKRNDSLLTSSPIVAMSIDWTTRKAAIPIQDLIKTCLCDLKPIFTGRYTATIPDV